MTVNVLLTGGRDYTDKDFFDGVMTYTRNRWFMPICMIIGYDPEKKYPTGLDQLAYQSAIDWGVEHKLFPYHYHLGKAGGSSRNQQMLDEGKPDIVLAFPTPNSRGTWDMVRRAKLANVPVEIFKYTPL